MALRIQSVAIGLLLIGWLTLANSAQSGRSEICDLAEKRGGLTLFADDRVETGDGERRIENVHVGGGNVEDELLWFCPGCGSIIPADPCTLRLTLGSSGETYTLEEQRLHVVNYKDTFYAVTGWIGSKNALAHTDIHRLEDTGFHKLCSMIHGPNGTVERDAPKSGTRPSP